MLENMQNLQVSFLLSIDGLASCKCNTTVHALRQALVLEALLPLLLRPFFRGSQRQVPLPFAASLSLCPCVLFCMFETCGSRGFAREGMPI
jgi:hypothetical protein